MEKDCSGSAKRPAAEVVGGGGAAATTTTAAAADSAIASSCSSGPDAKKPRAAAGAAAAAPPPTRLAVLAEKFDGEDGETKKLGLRDLFGRSASSSSSTQRGQGQGHGGGRAAARRFPRLPRGGGVGGLHPPSHQPQHPPPQPESDGFFTFRLERRKGGIMARHAGEERVLLFRSDRKGAVAKIVFSSHGAPAAPAGAKPTGGGSSVSADTAAEAKSAEGYGESELRQMAQAKIHVLDVKEPYRGRDLGGLLFSEAVQSLRDQYGRADEKEEDDEASAGEGHNTKAAAVPPLSSLVRCQLDAEEDVRRHNKLVGFYEGLGCRIKPKATIRYIPNPNNESETYRKVPMQMALLRSAARDRKLPAVGGADGRSASAPPRRPRRRQATKAARSLVGRRGGFLPVRLLDSSGRTIGVPAAPRRTDWLILDDGDGAVRFRTTQGLCVATKRDGRVVTLSPSDCDDDDCCDDMKCSSSDDAAAGANCSCRGCLLPDEREKFRLCRVPDGAGASFLGGGGSGPSVVSDSDTSDDESVVSPNADDDDGDGGARRREELFTLRSSHGTFLSADPVTHSLTCTDSPAFWRADRYDLSLTCTASATATTAADPPPPPSSRRRTHLRRTWKTQSVEYVRTMRDRYLSFRRGRCDVRSALERARSLPCRPFRVREGEGGGGAEAGGQPSLRTFSFRLAEHARRAGLPDWIQMAALVHELGRVVPLLDSPAAAATAATEAGAKDEDDEESDGGYDWTLPCRSRVVGCAPPERSASSSFHDFRDLNPDRCDGRYDSALGMYEEHCGLDDVLLSWSGPEYAYHMLRHNGASMPEEGLAMIRLFSLRDWHERGEYRQIANDDDEDRRLFVSEFYWMRRTVLRECGDDGKDLSDAECDRLWKCYFSNVLEKYSCGGELSW